MTRLRAMAAMALAMGAAALPMGLPLGGLSEDVAGPTRVMPAPKVLAERPAQTNQVAQAEQAIVETVAERYRRLKGRHGPGHASGHRSAGDRAHKRMRKRCAKSRPRRSRQRHREATSTSPTS
jgi:hypothetical protein